MENLSWDDLRVLLAVHREGSLLAAGRSLGLSTSTTGRRLDALEAALGGKLVHRAQSGTVLEPEALRLVRLAEELAHGLDARQRDQRSVSTLRVSVPDGMAKAVAQSLLAIRDEHPPVHIELLGENRMADLAKREADIGVRLVRSTSNVLVEKHLATLRFALYAAPDYVRRHLRTRRLRREDVAAQSFVGLDPRWKDLPHEQWMRSLGAVHFPFRSSSMEALDEAVRQGVGIAAMLERDPRNEGLVHIEAETTGPTQAFYLAYHRDLRKLPHVRAAVLAIESSFKRI
jgi:DNA-binding transcriptional LysR family regulator